MIRWLKQLLARWRAPIFVHAAAPIQNVPWAPDPDWARPRTYAEIREDMVLGTTIGGVSRDRAERFCAHLLGEKPLTEKEMVRLIISRDPPPVTDWDVAQGFEQPEPGCVEYRFLGVTGEEDA